MKLRKDAIWFDDKIRDIQSQFSDYLEAKTQLKPREETLKIIALYVFIGGLWILLSDMVLSFLVRDPDMLIQLGTYKGWFYVALTGLIFYFIIYEKINLFKKAVDKIFEGFEDLSAAHEELLAMDEELIHQFDEIEKHRNALMISDQRYELAVEGANDGIWDWDLESDNYFFSLKGKGSFGYDDTEIPNRHDSWKQLLHPEDREKAVKLIESYLASQSGIYESTYRLKCKDGGYRWILSRGKGIWDKEGHPVRVAGSHTDITEYMELQERLYQEKELYQNIIHGAAVFILGVDTEGRIFEFNPFAEKLTGYTKNEVLGTKWFDMFIPQENRKQTDEIIQAILRGETIQNQENQVVTREGRRVDILWNNSVFRDSKGTILGIIAMGTDITERKAMESKLMSLAYYDGLTNLPNRQMFEKILKKQILQAKTNEKKLALLYLDLDNFKKINDTLGHHYGDKLLQGIADGLRATMKEGMNISRLSGDEFAVILPNVMDAKTFHSEVIAIMEAINKSWVIEGNELYITSSVGIAIYPDDGQDVQALLKNADTAMYAAKENEKNSFAFYTPEMHEKSLNFFNMEMDLRNALMNKEFILYYQPLINLSTGKIIGVEALIRWLHPERGMVPPNDFIPFAEESGAIIHIGEWVIQEACRQLKNWYNMELPQIYISVNLSARQIRQQDLIEKIIHITEEMGVDGRNLLFEITENVALHDLRQSIHTLNMLRSMNMRVALDDFGTGYSSLNYLKKLPIDMIKIDRSFVRDITEHLDERFIAKTIIDLAHNMDVIVTAEGIETETQYKILQEYGCDFGQGYLFSKPVPAEEIEKLLLRDKKIDN
ncbi:bifunctional diguanylate cyclase/phosphodiesterase [Anaerosolibacter sp.]|uniref:bifunctional diguanylate cyclase/phosphodiesterase n=1 Tax=Anaerosolibacter sp. TaxID=1872527 RepID=UPI0039F01AC6